MNLRLQQLMAEVDVLEDQARLAAKTSRMEVDLAGTDSASLAELMASNAGNLRLMADLHNAMADRYDELAHLLRA